MTHALLAKRIIQGVMVAMMMVMEVKAVKAVDDGSIVIKKSDTLYTPYASFLLSIVRSNSV